MASSAMPSFSSSGLAAAEGPTEPLAGSSTAAASATECVPSYSLKVVDGAANYHGRQTFLGGTLQENSIFQVIVTPMEREPQEPLWFSAGNYFNRVPQIYKRTANYRNNFPVWQGLSDPTWYITRDDIPISIFTDQTSGTVVRIPDASATTTISAWKLTRSTTGIQAIPSGFDIGTELVRGSDMPVVNDGGVSVGVLAGGLPAFGVYFSAGVLSGCDLTLFDKYWMSPDKSCEGLGCQECLGYSLSIVGTLEEFMAAAEDLCTAEEGVFVDVVIKQSYDLSDPTLPASSNSSSSSGTATSSSSPGYLIEGTVCCTGTTVQCAINQPSETSSGAPSS